MRCLSTRRARALSLSYFTESFLSLYTASDLSLFNSLSLSSTHLTLSFTHLCVYSHRITGETKWVHPATGKLSTKDGDAVDEESTDSDGSAPEYAYGNAPGVEIWSIEMDTDGDTSTSEITKLTTNIGVFNDGDSYIVLHTMPAKEPKSGATTAHEGAFDYALYLWCVPPNMCH